MTSNRVVGTLHDEHRATLAVLDRLDAFIARERRGVPAAGSEANALALREIANAVESEVKRHFEFEERHLFTFLEALGDAAIGAHLRSEHDAMRPIGERLATLARAAANAAFDAAGWQEFRRLAAELSERMVMHIQKEEMALLPLLEESMDAETELRLYDTYSGND
jgi:hemerythrin-like domain-containing protein